jgi:hypothetical protein
MVLLNYFWVKGCEIVIDKDYSYLYGALISSGIHLIRFAPLCYYWKDLMIDLFFKIIFDDEITRKQILFSALRISLTPAYLKKVSDGYYKV